MGHIFFTEPQPGWWYLECAAGVEDEVCTIVTFERLLDRHMDMQAMKG